MKPHKILERFNSEIRGFYNYYCIANNCSGQCSSFAYIMEYSLCKTLAQKLNTTKIKIKSRYTNTAVSQFHIGLRTAL